MIVGKQVMGHVKASWWKLGIFYFVAFFILFSSSVGYRYAPQDVLQSSSFISLIPDTSYKYFCFLLVVLLVFLFYFLYRNYQSGKTRWLLLSRKRWQYVLADITFVMLAISILYILFISAYLTHSYSSIMNSVLNEKLAFKQVFDIFTTTLNKEIVMLSFLPLTLVGWQALLLLGVQVSSLLVACIMVVIKLKTSIVEWLYLFVSLLVTISFLVYTKELFQSIIYIIFIMGNIVLSIHAWSTKEMGG